MFSTPRKSFFITEVFLLCLLFTSCAPSAQQTNPEKEISSSLLKTDFNIFRKTVEEAHPGAGGNTNFNDPTLKLTIDLNKIK